MSFYEWVGNIAAVISFFSLIGNVLQYTRRRETDKDLRKLVQEQYNNYYYIARSLTRSRNDSQEADLNEAIELYKNECNYIRGIADSARESLICFGREQLNYEVYFEHPAYPGKSEYCDEVLMGLPPELSASQLVQREASDDQTVS